MTFRPDSKTTHKDDAGYYMLYKDGQLLTDLKSSDLCIFTEEQARSLVASPNPVSYTHLTLPTNREV